jgi:hypothetical protein
MMSEEQYNFFKTILNTKSTDQQIIDSYNNYKKEKTFETINENFKVDIINVLINKNYENNQVFYKYVRDELTVGKVKKIQNAVKRWLSVMILNNIPFDNLPYKENFHYAKQAKHFMDFIEQTKHFYMYNFIKLNYTDCYSRNLVLQKPEMALFYFYLNPSILYLPYAEEKIVLGNAIKFLDDILKSDFYLMIPPKYFLEMNLEQKELFNKASLKGEENDRVNYFQKIYNIGTAPAFNNGLVEDELFNNHDIITMGWHIPKEKVLESIENLKTFPSKTQVILKSLYAFYTDFSLSALQKLTSFDTTAQDIRETLASSSILLKKVKDKDINTLAVNNLLSLGYCPEFLDSDDNNDYINRLSLMIKHFDTGFTIYNVNIFRTGYLKYKKDLTENYTEKLFYYLSNMALTEQEHGTFLTSMLNKNPFCAIELLRKIASTPLLEDKNGFLTTYSLKEKIISSLVKAIDRFPYNEQNKWQYFLKDIFPQFKNTIPDISLKEECDQELLLSKLMYESGKSKRTLLSKIKKETLLKEKKIENHLKSFELEKVFKRTLLT